MIRSFSVSLALFILLAGAGPARAQFGGQPGGMGPGMGPQPMGEEPREEGPAEAAPEEETERPSDLEPLGGYPQQQRQRAEIIELDGYFRTRTDFFHKLHLGQGYVMEGQPEMGPPPFPLPLECGVAIGSCDHKNLGGANLRLRLEPIINVTDQVRVLAQVDLLDNILLGSTPDSLVYFRDPALRTNAAPHPSLYNTQRPPEVSINSWESSVRAKRAWGEVYSEFGSLWFGRMPWHFGRGLTFNDGECPDCEEGTTVDRIMGLTQVYGHQLMLAWDFGPQGYHAGLGALGVPDVGYPLDLSQNDDVLQITGAFRRIDTDQRFRERVGFGELAVNYGVQLVYRKQGHTLYDLADDPATGMAGEGGPLGPTRDRLATSLTLDTDSLIFLPSLWFKLGWRALTIEGEASAVLGRIERAGPLSEDTRAQGIQLDLRQLGWVLASELRLYRDALSLGVETGGATGDQAENPRAYLNYRWKFVPQPPGDRTISDFKFNPDYHVDQILFRRIIGTVTNAIYVKPQLTYWMDLLEDRQIGLNAALIYSFAPEPVATPGNAYSYGVEMNLGANYRNPSSGFYAGVVWGVLWPMAALNRPGPTAGERGIWPRAEDASSSQVLRGFFGISF